MNIVTLTAAEAAETLRSCGVRISPDTIRDGLKDRRFTFGTYIPKESGSCVCLIYKRLFDKWMTERAIDEIEGEANEISEASESAAPTQEERT